MVVRDNIVLLAQVATEDHLLVSVEEALGKLKNDMDFPDITAVMVLGSTKHEMFDLAKANKADLMVVGLYGCHGISRLLGSTIKAVRDHVPGDILVMHIEEQQNC